MAGHEIGDAPVDSDALASPSGPSFSFELYPPRSAAAEEALEVALAELVASGPEFISVTYGANGSTRGVSLGLLRHLVQNTTVAPMAHFTAVGSSFAEASQLVREFLDAGVTRFLALRGDPPDGVSEADLVLGDFGSASELVQLIHGVQAEREPFVTHPMPGFPGGTRLRSGRKVTIAVAAFPNGHPRSRSRSQDLDTLVAKEAAGANLAITQLFFEPDVYLDFVDAARSAGVTMPILPGIMPVLSEKRLHRILELTGEAMPQRLLRDLRASDDQAAVGVAHAAQLAREILAGGAPGIHLYTFNRSDAPLAVLREVGLLAPLEISA
ncbi:MAG: 5,10-methylenetetrahydrofolate reductase [Acidobacteria bacterium]|nr:5,10-methylenetetrahydrofolate reductase [Acidobacteriota bacterium]